VTVTITGRGLTIREVVRVARRDERVELSPDAVARMRAARDVVDRALASGAQIYGLSTGLGVLKRDRAPAGPEALSDFNRRLIGMHRTGQGPEAPRDVVRATMLRLANHFALGTPGVRPELAELVVEALNTGPTPSIRTLGSVGQADLMLTADLAHGLLARGEFALAPGEGLALLNNNSFSTGWAALAVSDAVNLLSAMETAGALSLEAFVANLTMLHPSIAEVRPYPGIRTSLARLRALLDGSPLWEPDAARNLQDPLTFRNLPQLQGAARDALGFAQEQLAVELNASQGNPIVVTEEDRVISVANFEVVPLAAALDLLRIALAPALTSAGERTVKLLETPWSGLPTGLVARQGVGDAGLGYLGIAAQSLVSEARLLAQPVSFEMASSAHAEGIEDRTTMAPLAVRRLAEMVGLGERVVAIELVVASQAVDLRGSALGGGTARARDALRATIPFVDSGNLVPQDLQPVADAVRTGRFSAPDEQVKPPKRGSRHTAEG
jgi:histidine ammonia-lyase